MSTAAATALAAELRWTPELARAIYDAAPGKTFENLTTILRSGCAAGALSIENLDLAAGQFLGLLQGYAGPSRQGCGRPVSQGLCRRASHSSPGTEIYDTGSFEMSDAEQPRRGRPRDAAKDEAILLAAGDLFLERGFDTVSLDTVAHDAGVSKATIYARYADKDALFAAVLRQECERVVSPDSFFPAPDQPVRDTLIVLATRFLDLVTGDKPLQMHRVLVADTTRAPRMAELFYETAVESLKNRFAAWLEVETSRGRLRVIDPHGAAWRFLGAVKGEAHLRAAFGLPSIDPERLRIHIEHCADEFIRAQT